MAESITEVPNITAPFIRVIYVHILTSLSEYEHLKDVDRDPWVIYDYNNNKNNNNNNKYKLTELSPTTNQKL